MSYAKAIETAIVALKEVGEAQLGALRDAGGPVDGLGAQPRGEHRVVRAERVEEERAVRDDEQRHADPSEHHLARRVADRRGRGDREAGEAGETSNNTRGRSERSALRLRSIIVLDCGSRPLGCSAGERHRSWL